MRSTMCRGERLAALAASWFLVSCPAWPGPDDAGEQGDAGPIDGGGEGEGEGDLYFVDLTVTDLVDGQWSTTVVPNTQVLWELAMPVAVAAGDVDGDGLVDVAVAGYTGLYVVRDLLGPAPVMDLVFEVEPYAYNITQVALEDMDGDGLRDLIVASVWDWVLVRPALGDGTFGPSIALTQTIDDDGFPGSCQVAELGRPCAGTFVEAALVDLDADGDLDIVTAGRGVNVFRNDGALAFTHVALLGALGDEQTTYEIITAAAWRDGDQMRILGTGRWDWYYSTTEFPPVDGAVFALASNDLTTWSTTDSMVFNLVESNPRMVRVTLGFDGDAIACGRERRVVDLDAAGAITLGETLDFCPRLFGDVNGDGNTDMIPGGPDVPIAFGDGGGGYVVAELSATAPAGGGAALGDVNADGDLELIGFRFVGYP